MAQTPVELGRVGWFRGYEAAAALARERGVPLLILFDEVPGCSTVRAYGSTTLSDPHVVEAVETLFVGVVVQNNSAGEDRVVLERFGEPAWNNPVIRIVDPHTGSDLVPRLTHVSGTPGLLQTMVAAQGAMKHTVPDWLALLAAEANAAPTTATYAMPCFWSGEAHLGQHAAVVATKTGFSGGAEVVQVSVVGPVAPVDAWAAKAGYRKIAATSFQASPADDLHALRGTKWTDVAMTPAQASRVNAAVAAGEDPTRWLSPRQLDAISAATPR